MRARTRSKLSRCFFSTFMTHRDLRFIYAMWSLLHSRITIYIYNNNNNNIQR